MNQRNANNRDGNGRRNGNDENNEGNFNWWQTGTAAVGAAAVVGGLGALGYCWLTRDSTSAASQSTSQQHGAEQKSFFSTLAETLEAISDESNDRKPGMIPALQVSAWPNINSLSCLLDDIYERYIKLKLEDSQLYNKVFTEVFGRLHDHMKAVDKYYGRYSSNIQFVGSPKDRLRINKPDGFKIDLDIVISLPINMHRDPVNPEESDIVIEQKYPGFLQLRAGTQYQKILVRDGQECLINRTANEWLDNRNYILCSKFSDWFKSVGNRGLNQFQKMNGQPSCIVDGMKYTIRTSSGGPAWTIIIEAGLFRLDVDLVPALKFPESRWLEGRNYRKIPQECRRGYWMVVPEPHMAGQMDQDAQRSWHICLQSQEDQLFNNTYLLRKTFQLLEKLRDAQGMDKLAPYYIKTLFFWEIDDKKNTDPTFWQRKNIATLFEYMLNKLYEALDNGSIQYFWNKKNNLIGHLNTCTKNEYKGKFMYLLENIRDYKLVAKYLLTSVKYEEYQQFL